MYPSQTVGPLLELVVMLAYKEAHGLGTTPTIPVTVAVHPFWSETVTIQTPGHKLPKVFELFGNAFPQLQVYVYGPVPPIGITVILPSQVDESDALTTLTVAAHCEWAKELKTSDNPSKNLFISLVFMLCNTTIYKKVAS